eukprot:1183075-Prorocentrum_minimum.AAC.2
MSYTDITFPQPESHFTFGSVAHTWQWGPVLGGRRQWSSGAVEQWISGSVEQWSSGAVEQWSSGTELGTSKRTFFREAARRSSSWSVLMVVAVVCRRGRSLRMLNRGMVETVARALYRAARHDKMSICQSERLARLNKCPLRFNGRMGRSLVGPLVEGLHQRRHAWNRAAARCSSDSDILCYLSYRIGMLFAFRTQYTHVRLSTRIKRRSSFDQVAFGPKPLDKERAAVQIKVDGEEFVVGTLQKGTCDQFPVRPVRVHCLVVPFDSPIHGSSCENLLHLPGSGCNGIEPATFVRQCLGCSYFTRVNDRACVLCTLANSSDPYCFGIQVDLVLDVTSTVSHTGSTPIFMVGWWQVRMVGSAFRNNSRPVSPQSPYSSRPFTSRESVPSNLFWKASDVMDDLASTIFEHMPVYGPVRIHGVVRGVSFQLYRSYESHARSCGPVVNAQRADMEDDEDDDSEEDGAPPTEQPSCAGMPCCAVSEAPPTRRCTNTPTLGHHRSSNPPNPNQPRRLQFADALHSFRVSVNGPNAAQAALACQTLPHPPYRAACRSARLARSISRRRAGADRANRERSCARRRDEKKRNVRPPRRDIRVTRKPDSTRAAKVEVGGTRPEEAAAATG